MKLGLYSITYLGCRLDTRATLATTYAINCLQLMGKPWASSSLTKAPNSRPNLCARLSKRHMGRKGPSLLARDWSGREREHGIEFESREEVRLESRP